jgi:glutamate-1-semialdehyde 2,1-aminomutase
LYTEMQMSRPPSVPQVSVHLEVLRERYHRRHPKSARCFGAACTVLPGGNTRSVLYYEPFPIVIASGLGCRITDIDGNEFIDFLGEYSAGLYGHTHPVILAAIDRTAQLGLSLSGPSVDETLLAKTLCKRFPSIQQIRFTNSGTEANLMAIAAATAFTSRSRIIVFEGAYHGNLLTFLHPRSLANVPYEFDLLPYNDIVAAIEAFQMHGPRIAAVLVEPMQSASGSIPADPTFLTQLKALCERHGSVLIFDEIVTSRMSGGGMQALLGTLPDVTTLGKYVGGGLSFGAFGGHTEIMSLFDPRRSGALIHAGTFNNNILTMAVGQAGLSEVFTPEAARDLYELGEGTRYTLNLLSQRCGALLQFTGRGSVMTAHFVHGSVRSIRDLEHSDQNLKDIFFFSMLEKGIYLARRGMLTLSLPMGSLEIERLRTAVREFLVEYIDVVRMRTKPNRHAGRRV